MTVSLLDAAYALLVAGAAMSPWPWLALVVAGLFLGATWWLSDGRAAAVKTT